MFQRAGARLHTQGVQRQRGVTGWRRALSWEPTSPSSHKEPIRPAPRHNDTATVTQVQHIIHSHSHWRTRNIARQDFYSGEQNFTGCRDLFKRYAEIYDSMTQYTVIYEHARAHGGTRNARKKTTGIAADAPHPSLHCRATRATTQHDTSINESGAERSETYLIVGAVVVTGASTVRGGLRVIVRVGGAVLEGGGVGGDVVRGGGNREGAEAGGDLGALAGGGRGGSGGGGGGGGGGAPATTRDDGAEERLGGDDAADAAVHAVIAPALPCLCGGVESLVAVPTNVGDAGGSLGPIERSARAYSTRKSTYQLSNTPDSIPPVTTWRCSLPRRDAACMKDAGGSAW